MTNVIYGGQMESEESPLSGLSEAIGAGMQIRVARETLQQRERERVSREKAEENEISSALANQTLRKREQDIANVSKTHERFSMWWNGMDGQEKAIAKTSDQYKEMQKFFKGFKDLVPGLISDDGSIVASTGKDIFKNKLTELQSKAKINIANGTQTKEDVRLLQLTEDTKDNMSTALADAAEKLKKEGGPIDRKNFIQKFSESFFNAVKGAGTMAGNAKAQSQLSGGLAQPQQPQITQPVAPVNQNTQALAPANANQNDPLGILQPTGR